jgi:hypothetical protein
MSQPKLLLLTLAATVTLVACQWRAPTSSSYEGKISLTLDFAQWQEHDGEEGLRLARSRNLAAITRVEIYVLFEQDTLAHATAPVASGSNEFSAVLEAPIGGERRVIVEAWDDQSGEGPPMRAFRGVQTGVEVQPNLAREVEVTLYPLPVAGQSVVLIIGNAQGAPGTGGHLAPVTLISADSLSGVQFDLNYDGGLISPTAALRAKTIAFDTLASNVVASEQGQALRVLLFSLSGKRLPALFDPAVIMSVAFQVSEGAPVGARSALILSNFAVLDHQRKRLGVLAVEGGNFEVVGAR